MVTKKSAWTPYWSPKLAPRNINGHQKVRLDTSMVIKRCAWTPAWSPKSTHGVEILRMVTKVCDWTPYWSPNWVP